jgi:hypothetical protein
MEAISSFGRCSAKGWLPLLLHSQSSGTCNRWGQHIVRRRRRLFLNFASEIKVNVGNLNEVKRYLVRAVKACHMLRRDIELCTPASQCGKNTDILASTDCAGIIGICPVIHEQLCHNAAGSIV